MDDVQAVVQILAEDLFLHALEQIAVGGRDHAHVDAILGAIGADPLDLAGLEKPQQQPLHARRRFADLVHEHGTAMGEFEDAGSIADRAGEAAAHVAEQLGLEQRFGERRAIDGDERGSLALAVGVDQMGDDFLADPAFTGDQDLGIASRRVLDLGADRFELIALPEQIDGWLCARHAAGQRCGG